MIRGKRIGQIKLRLKQFVFQSLALFNFIFSKKGILAGALWENHHREGEISILGLRKKAKSVVPTDGQEKLMTRHLLVWGAGFITEPVIR